MKAFEDLKFEKDYGSGWLSYDGSKKAVMKFDNGFSIKVGQGLRYHSSSDEYEVEIFKKGEKVTTIFHWSDLQYCSKEEVTRIMVKIQELK